MRNKGDHSDKLYHHNPMRANNKYTRTATNVGNFSNPSPLPRKRDWFSMDVLAPEWFAFVEQPSSIVKQNQYFPGLIVFSTENWSRRACFEG